MSSFEHDLRAALSPLAGDPRAVAARVLAVLAALPPTPPDFEPLELPQRPRWPVGPLLIGLALGTLLGFAGARLLQAPPQNPKFQSTIPAVRSEVLAVVGSLERYGTRKELDRLQRGDPVPLGSWLQTTGDSSAAIRVAPGFEIILDESAGCRLDAIESIFAKEGRFYISVNRPTPIEFHCGQDVVVTARDAEFVVTTGANGTELAALRGSATLLVGKDRRTVKLGSMCRFDLKAGLSDASAVTPQKQRELVSWQAECLLALRR